MLSLGICMKLKELKKVIDKAVEYADGCDADVEVWLGKKGYRIRTIHQYGVVPDVIIELGEKFYEDKD